MVTTTLKTGESTTRTRTVTFTVPGLTSLNSATVNTGSITVNSVVGDKVSVTVSNGAYTRRPQTGGSASASRTQAGTQTAQHQYRFTCLSGPPSNRYDNAYYPPLPSTMEYNSGGYSGTLSKIGTTYTNDLSGQACSPAHSTNTQTLIANGSYSGTVSKPDTRTYTSYYDYSVTFDYETNIVPLVTLNTANDRSLSEGTKYLIEGSALDEDNGNVIYVYYSINDDAPKQLGVQVSDGVTPLVFAKELVIKNSVLYDGATAITGTLAGGTNHTLKVWGQDDKQGTSTIVSKTFTVIPNRPPSPPGVFTKPLAGSMLFVKKPIEVAWGSSTDQDGNELVYILEVTLNGGAYTAYNEQSLTSRTITTLTTDQALTTARFRTRAKDVYGLYSDYIYSDTYTLSHNSDPTITVTSVAGKVLYNYQSFEVKGTVKDVDGSNALTVKYQIADHTVQSLPAITSNGTNQPFSKVLTHEHLIVKDGDTAVTGKLTEGYQTVKVWVVDNQGGTSEVKSFTIAMLDNTLPNLTLNGIEGGNSNVMNMSATDVDGTVAKVEVFVNESLQRTYVTGFDSPILFTIEPNTLFEGDNNEVKVVVTDTKGASITKKFQASLYLPQTPYIPDTVNFSIEGALSIVGAEESESYKPMTNLVVGLNLSTAEVQLIGSSVRNAKTTQRFTMKRSNVNIGYNINQYTGAIE